ncbi:uncharacterized protein LOC120937775 isoform X1 [Rana temporaria]|uniref:uncharacterized protein LOC120937775 isoform X1 n=1 Tax=Rana temporaria TaxID=8407 RepID=UPI001AAD1860|nr:uncharacterized protein LOC120937775 isoform X1 [Rana temporaria]
MNNCDLEKLSVPGVKLEPSFKPDITKYKVTVSSQRKQITVDAYPSDNGASCTVLGGEGSKVVTLKDGLNSVVVEVTAEDGTMKKYFLEITKLSASQALLEGIHLSEDLKLEPSFAPNTFEYSCTVPYFQNSIIVEPLVQDSQMKVTVNGSAEIIKPLSITVGDTLIEVLVMSPDGTKSQVYNIVVTREQVPFSVNFTDIHKQMNYECPISLTALYRPVSIKGSDPKHTMSAPYIDLLTRRAKTDPLDEKMLTEDWRVPEYELDMEISEASVMCCFVYRGCGDILKLTDLGNHAKNCLYKPPTELDPKAVTETEWFKGDSMPAKASEPYFQHTLQERNWEKRLQQIHNRDTDQLCSHAEENTRFYKQILLKSGDRLDHKDGMLALDALNQTAAAYASAIKLQPKNSRFHFLLAIALEELYYAAEIYGLKKKNEDEGTYICSAKATGKDEEIQAICKLHGFTGRPSLEQQLKALDMEYHQLKEQGQSGRADYIQNLYAWKSKQAGKSGMISLDEENPLTQALLKYKDALSLDLHNWQYNFHVGRHLLLQKQTSQALMFLQNALALRPASPIARCYVGLAILEQDGGPGTRTQESVTYLQQGMETFLNDLLTQEGSGLLLAENPLCLFNTQLLSGFVKFGQLLRTLSIHSSPTLMSSQQVLQMVADWSAKALCQCPHRGMVTQQLEWALLEACFGLLELLVEKSSKNEAWIGRRCQALSALIRLASIPPCKKLLDLQEKVCQLGVISSPCNSSALYLLGTAQLAQYDDRPSSEQAKQALWDAKLSFQASIRLENMPTKGQPPAELASQKWWQEWKAIEEREKQKQLNQTNADKPITSTTAATRGTPKGRGAAPMSRGANTTSRLSPSKRGGTVTQGGGNTKTGTPKGGNIKTDIVGGSSNNSGSTSVSSRGRGAPVLSKPATATFTKPQTKVNAATTVKVADPLPEKPASKDNPHPVQEQALGPISINHSSFLYRLGLARALSRSEETTADALDLYREVIKMAPEVCDAYTELAELLLKDDPLGAVEVYCQYPQKPVEGQSFDNAFIPGEIVRLLMKCEKYDDPRLPVNMISYGKVMGIGCLEKYINILEEKFKTSILKTVYAGIHNKSEDDKDLQDFFRFKCWI